MAQERKPLILNKDVEQVSRQRWRPGAEECAAAAGPPAAHDDPQRHSQHPMYNAHVDKEPDMPTDSLLAVPFYQNAELIGRKSWCVV